jgi:FtsP/CotA-like multicopper oxidase with cupredoxin domain
MRGFKVLGGAMALLIGTAAHAQVFQFPPQNVNGARGAYEQVNYPYPGQCQADTSLTAATENKLWGVPQCSLTTAKSFACPDPVLYPGVSNFTAGGWRACDAVAPFKVLQPNAVDPAQKYKHKLLNPFDYVPDRNKFSGADFYDIGVHEAWGFQNIAGLPGLFPDPTALVPPGPPVPNGMQWTGLTCTTAPGCTCPAEATAAWIGSYCTDTTSLPGTNLIPLGAPLYTPIWGVGQRNTVAGRVAGPTLAGALGVASPASPWSANDYIATWPSVSIRATKGRAVVVRWTNEFPNNHVFCPHPEAADWTCAIDRTFMGVKAVIDPAALPSTFDRFHNNASLVSPHGVNQFGGVQQPDNSWVTHLHGGEDPPSTDGFAEKWYGNAVSGALYSPTDWFLTPAFESPLPGPLFRPGLAPDRLGAGTLPAKAWNADTYTYPMDQDEALIWFHDHTLGKTHHNVIAGPAGFFPVYDPSKHGAVDANGACLATPPNNCDYTWLDPVTLPRFDLSAALGAPGNVLIPKYDLFIAPQDRSFNDDGSINFSNGLGQPVVGLPPEITTVTIGDNSLVHPVWIPEYFGDHVLMNGVLWPQYDTDAGWHRVRMANGSDSRCYTVGFSTILPTSGARPTNNVPFSVIASDQGYVRVPRAPATTPVSFCPGERLEFLINFSGLLAGNSVYMTNSAGSPFPAGETPFVPGGPWPDTNVMMRFTGTGVAGVPTCGPQGLTSYDPANPVTVGCIVPPDGTSVRGPDPLREQLRALVPVLGGQLAPVMCATPTTGTSCVSAVRQLYLNEKFDGTTGAPLGMQINGVPFEYKVTETPKANTVEVWEIINLTVDAHPMHPHAVKHLRVGRQKLNVGAYKAALCGSSTCQAGTAPGPEMYVVPDVRNLFPVNGVGTSALVGSFIPEPVNSPMSGFKDASHILPGETLVIIALWEAGYEAVPGKVASPASAATAPGSSSGPVNLNACPGAGSAVCDERNWTFEGIDAGPYVWHCHINSHEDSEMMRTSLIIR